MDWNLIIQMVISFLLGGVLIFVLGLTYSKQIIKLYAFVKSKIGKDNAEKAFDTGGTILIDIGADSVLVEEDNTEIKKLAEEIKAKNIKMKELIKKKLKG